jgi:hypothetical protein
MIAGTVDTLLKLKPFIVTGQFYAAQPFLAGFQRKKNQALFLPLPVRK